MKRTIPLAALFLVALLPAAAAAIPGDLDTTFNPPAGYAAYDLGIVEETEEVFYDTAVQPDGKIVAVGYIMGGATADALVVRFNGDGTLDDTFGTGGVAVIDFDNLGADDYALGVAVQPDGKIVAVGVTRLFDNQDILVFRLDRDGSLDESFGTGGMTGTDFSLGNNDFGYDVEVMPDGRIVVAGTTTDGPNPWEGNADAVIVMMNSDGSPDTSFNWPVTPGHVRWDGTGRDGALAVDVMPDGRVVAAGYTEDGGVDKVLVLRYTKNGAPDTSLASDGSLAADAGGSAAGWGVRVQPDGKIVVAGDFYAGSGNGNDMFVLRTTEAGTPDGGFHSDGWATWSYGSDSIRVKGMFLQPDGRIVVAGSIDGGPASGALVWRFTTAGNLDTSFSVDGVANFGSNVYDRFFGAALQPDGKIVAAGAVMGASDPEGVVARFIAEDFASVRVLTPNGGEEVPAGREFAVGWGAPPWAVTFKVRYSLDNGTTWKSAASAAEGTQHVWQAPRVRRNKKKCLLKVIGYDAGGNRIGADRSNGTFALEVVKVTAPANGDILDWGDTYGNTHSIRWRTARTRKPVAEARIYLSKNGGVSWSLIKKDVANSGLFVWPMPTVAADKTDCKIKVVLKRADGKTLGADVSDGTFALMAP